MRGTPAACFCPQAGCCPPGVPQRMQEQRHLAQSFQQMAPLPCCGSCCQLFHWLRPGGWGLAPVGAWERSFRMPNIRRACAWERPAPRSLGSCPQAQGPWRWGTCGSHPLSLDSSQLHSGCPHPSQGESLRIPGNPDVVLYFPKGASPGPSLQPWVGAHLAPPFLFLSPLPLVDCGLLLLAGAFKHFQDPPQLLFLLPPPAHEAPALLAPPTPSAPSVQLWGPCTDYLCLCLEKVPQLPKDAPKEHLPFTTCVEESSFFVCFFDHGILDRVEGQGRGWTQLEMEG